MTPNRLQAKKDKIAVWRLIKLYRSSDDQEEKDGFAIGFASILGTVVISIMTMIYEPGDRLYPKAHITLAFVVIASCLTMFYKRDRVKQVFAALRKIASGEDSASLSEIGDSMLAVSWIIVSFMALFVLDYQFYKYYLLNIGTIALSIGLWSLWHFIRERFSNR